MSISIASDFWYINICKNIIKLMWLYVINSHFVDHQLRRVKSQLLNHDE